MTTPPFIMPSMADIGVRYFSIWSSDPGAIISTFIRIIVGLGSAFVVGVSSGVAMGMSSVIRGYGETFVKFLTGIPGLSWVLIAVLWFGNVELRIVFVLFMVLFPWYSLSTMDAVRGIPRDYTDMVKSFRFTRREYTQKLIVPYILPDIVSVSKSNIGYAARIVVVAELVGATSGIGRELLVAQGRFNIVDIFAWTFVLVTVMLSLQAVLLIVERTQLDWRETEA
jgi:NitT/TauT family transport system permease protein